MTGYHVSWHVDLQADSPERAAVLARLIQRDRTITRTVFQVTPNGSRLADIVEVVDEAGQLPDSLLRATRI